MIKITQYRVGVSPKGYIQKLIDMLSLDNGSITIKVQNKKFVHLSINPTFTPNEMDDTEIASNETI